MDKQQQNYEMWQHRANTLDVQADTFDDIYKRELENKLIFDRIPNGCSLLDVGCGSGYGTNLYSTKAKFAVGIDYSDNMINKANETYKRYNLKFYHRNILNIDDFDNTKYDVVICQRSLINILDYEKQLLAIKNIHSLLNENGIFLMLEAPEDSRHKINEMRIKYDIPELPELTFNLNFNEQQLQKDISNIFEIKEKIYTGYYDFISKVVYPLISYPNSPHFKHPVNKLSMEIMMNDNTLYNVLSEYSRCFLYVLQKIN